MAEKKVSTEMGADGLAESRVDVVLLVDSIGWREQKTGPLAEQRASTRYHDKAEEGPEASIPEHELKRLTDLGAVAKKGSKAAKEAAAEEESSGGEEAPPPEA